MPSWWQRLLGAPSDARRSDNAVPAEPAPLDDPRFAASRTTLAEPSLNGRLEAITALGRRAGDAQEGPATLAFLAAWVRTPSPLSPDDSAVEEGGFELDSPTRRDLQAALDVLVVRQAWESPDGPRALDLGGADLHRAQLNGADLVAADLRDTDLREATLVGADLSAARLGLCDLGAADLSGARLDGASWEHGFATAAKLVGASLRGLDGTRLDMREADARDADFRDAVLHETHLLRTNLVGADLSGVTRLVAADLKQCFLAPSTRPPASLAPGEWQALLAACPSRDADRAD